MTDQEVLGPIIDGKVVASGSTPKFKAIYPVDGKEICEIYSCGQEQTDAAVRSSEEAFKSWGKTSFGERAAVLEHIARIVEENLEYFAKNETLDTGKGIGESLVQIGNSAKIYRYFASAIRSHEDRYIRYDNGTASVVIREPFGSVGLILPWNAPSMLLSWKLAPALAAGNCAIVKPASVASRAALNMVLRFQEALPPGVLNAVTGSGPDVGNALVKHPGIRKISFTGSTAVGREIGELCGNRLIPATLELGGKSASVIFDDANIERAIQFVMLGSLSSAGQICIAGTRILVQSTIYDSFVEKLKTKFDTLRVGDPMDSDTQMGPVINKNQFDKVMGYIDSGIKDGARLVIGGERLTGGIYDKGYYIAPTLFADVKSDMTIACEEIFGPVLSIMRFDTEEEAVSIANGTEYGLGASVWTKDINRAMRVSQALEAGTVWVNFYLDSPAGSPFGGYKKSGMGREIGKIAIDYYSNIKNINISSSDDVPPIF
ncbi:MAG: aldehyde dehydrogenase family protein [Synergistaceae bacterium]|jgi:acyl-CoA reductase-like NAD-dependent aldehyde dehydrogenase|nr:aldehyde dehydrogenase family protein [Synergistaceae bacterium]